MACEEEVTRLKKDLDKMSAEFRQFRNKVKGCVKKPPKGDVVGQTSGTCGPAGVTVSCDPCVAWTAI